MTGDARLDPNASHVVEILNDSDALAHLGVTGAFPVTYRDMVVAQRKYVSEDGQSGYFAARSVVDQKLPVSNIANVSGSLELTIAV
jgi:hypothetical protein